MARIAVGGFQHETNTFSDSPARLEDFVLGGGWPGLQNGPEMMTALQGMNLPISGAIAAVIAAGHEPVPLIWAAATPSGRVDQAAYDHIADLLVQSLRHCGPLDGLYLDLHGAMATTGIDDAEGALLQRIRQATGPALPLAVSVDLHANVSRQMFELSDIMVGYRSYPHVDMAETGARTVQALLGQIAAGRPPQKAWQQLDTLIPLTSQCTLVQPAAALYAYLKQLEQSVSGSLLSLTLGFPLADIADCGPAIFAYGDDAQAIGQLGQSLRMEFERLLPQFHSKIYDAEEGVQEAMRLVADGIHPVILADTQDNPGGGGASDTTGLLQALLSMHAQEAVLAVMFDPDAAETAHKAGVGARLDIALGGKTPGAGSGPTLANYLVERLEHGVFMGSGPMWGGMPIDLGRMALLRADGVHIIVASRKMQAGDQSILVRMGIQPSACKMIVLKSSVHFRADFDAIAGATLIVASPGAVTARLKQLPFRHLRAGMHLLG